MLSVRKIRPEVGAHISVTMMIDDYAVALVNCGKSVGTSTAINRSVPEEQPQQNDYRNGQKSSSQEGMSGSPAAACDAGFASRDKTRLRGDHAQTRDET